MLNFCNLISSLLSYLSDLNIPYLCLIESDKTYLRIIGKKYHYVPFDSGVIEPEKPETWRLLQGKSHSTIQQAVDKDDPTFKEIKAFIDRVIPDSKKV